MKCISEMYMLKSLMHHLVTLFTTPGYNSISSVYYDCSIKLQIYCQLYNFKNV